VSFASLVDVLIEPRDIILAQHFLFNYWILVLLLLLLFLFLFETSAINETPESLEKNNSGERRMDASKLDMFFSVHYLAGYERAKS